MESSSVSLSPESVSRLGLPECPVLHRVRPSSSHRPSVFPLNRRLWVQSPVPRSVHSLHRFQLDLFPYDPRTLHLPVTSSTATCLAPAGVRRFWAKVQTFYSTFRYGGSRRPPTVHCLSRGARRSRRAQGVPERTRVVVVVRKAFLNDLIVYGLPPSPLECDQHQYHLKTGLLTP